MLILYFAILGVIAYLIETYLPMPAPFKIVMRVIIVLFAIFLLLNALGWVNPPMPLRR